MATVLEHMQRALKYLEWENGWERSAIYELEAAINHYKTENPKWKNENHRPDWSTKGDHRK